MESTENNTQIPCVQIHKIFPKTHIRHYYLSNSSIVTYII